jgi:hypothetical protein
VLSCQLILIMAWQGRERRHGRELGCPPCVDDAAAGVLEYSPFIGGELVPHVGRGPLRRGAEPASRESDDLVPPPVRLTGLEPGRRRY